MARRKRMFRQNIIHHVMLRGINGDPIFRDHDDYVRFCLILQAACEKHNFAVHGFCFMTNHIHLAIEPLTDSFHQGIHAFAFRYAQHFNSRHDRRGYLFQGRYRSIIVDNGIYIKRLIRYIHLNPTEAKLVSDPELYPWSSYKAYLQKEHFAWLTTDRILSWFGTSKFIAIEDLVNYTNRSTDSKDDAIIFEKAHRSGCLEDESMQEFYSKGDIEFSDKSRKQLSEEANYSIDEICQAVCQHFGISHVNLIGDSKTKADVDARSAVAAIVRKNKRWSLSEAGAFLNKSSGTMSRLANRADNNKNLLSSIETIKDNLKE